MKKTFLLVPLAIILVMSLFLVSCEDEPELKSYKVTFLKDKGDTTPYHEKTVLEGTGITEAPKEPTKEGHDFEYWKLVDGESKYDLNTPVKSDLTLVASWKIKEFTVYFMDGETQKADSQTVEYGKTATAPTAPTKEGHTFSCWKKVGSSSPFDFETEMITEDTVLEAVWDINTYTVTFKNADGTDYATKDVLYNGKVDKPEGAPTPKEGYSFKHWATSADPKSGYDFATPITNNLVLYPVFEINEYTVTFIGDEHISSVPNTQKVAYGSYAKDPNATAKDGYIITGWTTDKGVDTPFNFTSSPIEADITLYPIVKEGWKLKFYVGEELVHTSGVELGSTFVYPDKPTKEGYDFAGWKKKDKEVYIYSSTVIDSDMELEACWNKAGLLSITNTGNVKGNTDPEVEVIIIPENINGVTPTKIADSAFKQWTNITTVVLPPTINSIGNSAFYGCSNLSQCILSDNITTIGYSAFRDCSNLSSINIPNGVTVINNSAFEDCTSLTSITIPASCKTIGGYAFNTCSSLETVIINDGCTSIGGKAFRWCKNLTSIVVPSTVTSFGDWVFGQCTSLTSAVIQAKVSTIDINTFNGCDALQTISLSNSISSLPDNTFGNLKALQSISIPDENMSFKSVDGVLYDKNITKLICFPANKNVTTYTVPETVTEIGAYAFRNNQKLTSIIIPKSVKSIGVQALYSCTKLSDVYINQAKSELFKDSYISSKVTKHWNSTGPAQVN